MLPMMMMMGGMGKKPDKAKHEELLEVLKNQEEKIKQMLEEQQAKKAKEATRAKNEALMERLFQIEEQLLNTDKPKQKVKKVDFVELMKAQQLYQQQLVETLIEVNKKPKKTFQPTIYLPVPIRDPNLLPPSEEDLQSTQNVRSSTAGPKQPSFGQMWDQSNNSPLKPTRAMSGSKSNLKLSNPQMQPSGMTKQDSLRSVPMVPNQLKTGTLPQQGPAAPHTFSSQMQMAGATGLKTQPMVASGVPGMSMMGPQPPGNFTLPPAMQPNVLRIYKMKKDQAGAPTQPVGRRKGPYVISKLRKYALAVHFAMKLKIFAKKEAQRQRKESRLYFDENCERMYVKAVKFLKSSLNDILTKIWSLDEPISITRRKKLYVQYGVETSTMTPDHWDTVNTLLIELLEGLNKFFNSEFLNPEIVNFFGKSSNNRAFLNPGHYFESMLDRLEFDANERVINQTDQRVQMVLIFELIFECLINRLLTSPKDFLVLPPQNEALQRFNTRTLGSVLFALFEDWIVSNVSIDKRSVKRPEPRMNYIQLDKKVEPSIKFIEAASAKEDWKKRLFVFSDIIPRDHLTDLQNFFATEDYELLETIRDTFLQKLLNAFLSSDTPNPAGQYYDNPAYP